MIEIPSVNSGLMDHEPVIETYLSVIGTLVFSESSDGN